MEGKDPFENGAPNGDAGKWDMTPSSETTPEAETPQENGFDGAAYIEDKQAELEREAAQLRETLAPGSNATPKEQMAARSDYESYRIKMGVLRELDPKAEGGIEGSAQQMLAGRMKAFQEALSGQGPDILGETEDGHIEVVEEMSALCYLLSDIKFKKGLEARKESSEA